MSAPHSHPSWRLCSCAPCRERLRVYNRDYMRDLRADPGPRLVDAAPTRARLLELRAAGWTLKEIAARSGYALPTLASVSSGRTRRVRTVMAEDITAMTVQEEPA